VATDVAVDAAEAVALFRVTYSIIQPWWRKQNGSCRASTWAAPAHWVSGAMRMYGWKW